MKTIAKKIVQDYYLRPVMVESINLLRHGHLGLDKDDIFQAFEKALSLYNNEESGCDYNEFVQATIVERGHKVEGKYEGMYVFVPLWPWTKWKMKHNGLYTSLPKELPAYWLFLVIMVEGNLSAQELADYREKILAM